MKSTYSIMSFAMKRDSNGHYVTTGRGGLTYIKAATMTEAIDKMLARANKVGKTGEVTCPFVNCRRVNVYGPRGAWLRRYEVEKMRGK